MCPSGDQRNDPGTTSLGSSASSSAVPRRVQPVKRGAVGPEPEVLPPHDQQVLRVANV